MNKFQSAVRYSDNIVNKNIILRCTCASLFLLSGLVLFSWHNPNTLPSIHTPLVAMAYNTALCIFLAGIGLFAIGAKKHFIILVSALCIFVISSLTIFEFATGFSVGVNFWFLHIINDTPENPSVMALTTSICLAFISISLALVGLDKTGANPKTSILAVLLNLITITISAIALLGYGMGAVPALVWLGIKMALHTSVSIILFSSTFIFYHYQDFSEKFNRENFLYRMSIGFGSMALLAIAIGSIALMQINNVTSITQELYQKPLQINNSAIKIKQEINQLNRLLKNIAITKNLYNPDQMRDQIELEKESVQQEIASIRSSHSIADKDIFMLEAKINKWNDFTANTLLLIDNNFDSYKENILNNGQEQVIDIENMLDQFTNVAQTQITALYTAVIGAKKNAETLVTLMLGIFLFLGLFISTIITRSLNSQLQKIRNVMFDIAHEQNDHPIPFLDYEEEIGDMARALSIFELTMKARQRLETRLRQVIEATPNGIIMVNAAGVIEIFNKQAEVIFGYARNEVIGQPIEILIPENKRHNHPHDRNAFLSHPTPRKMGAERELFGLHKNGGEFPVEIGLAPIETEEGMKVLASIVDITERKNANTALNESRELVELTTRVNEIGIWEYDVTDEKLTWSDTMFGIYERKKELFNCDYNGWKQCIHPNDIENTEKLLQESLNTLTPFAAKFRISLPDGRTKHILAKANVEKKPQNNHIRMLGTNIDITREELAYSKLHQLETLRASMVEHSDDGIISKTLYGMITSWNSGATAMFGYTADEAIGKPISGLLFPEHLLHEEEELLSKVRAGNVVKNFETVRKCKDGHLINVSITLSPIKDTTGKLIGVSSIKRDITDTILSNHLLAQRQIELEKANSELERSNKELETFAYVASHDLKSPLRGIAQLSNWIEEDLESKEFSAVSEHSEKLRNRILRMEKLLDDLLIFYRAGKTEGEKSVIDVDTMARELFEIQHIKPGLLLEIIGTLPTFETLSTPFEQVLRNLFSNAIKHHDKEQGVIQLSCRELDNNYYEFCVSDDGPGVPEKFHERIFGMFQTLKSRDELEGSGIGLALIKKIVHNYGGYITLKSEGRGCSFYFSWPKEIERSAVHD